MTDTAKKILDLFGKGKEKAGMVLTFSQLTLNAKGWGQDHVGRLEEAAMELKDEGYVIITPTNGLELTEKGYDYLLND